MNYKPQGGLAATPDDKRDYELGAVYKLPELKDLPLELILPYTVKHQGGSDFCSAYTSCAVSEVQEGMELEPSWSFAASKQISGNVYGWGQDLRSAMKAHVDYGALQTSKSPYNVENKDTDFLRNLANWDFPQSVEEQKKRTFFKITGQYDQFDNIRASLFKFDTPVAIGVQFGWKLTDHIFDEVKDRGFGHAMTVIGYTTMEDGRDVAVLLNSYGKEAGKNGIHYITREVLNHFVERYGAYTFTDMHKETAKYYSDNGIIEGDNWVIQLIKALISLFK